MPARLVVLASGTGTLLQALIDARTDASYPAEVVAVVCDRPHAYALVRARGHGIATGVVVASEFSSRASWDAALTDAVTAYEPDLVVLAGFMKMLSPTFLQRLSGRVINTHPALLPAFPGAHAVRDALAAGVKVTGASVIWVDEGIDTGQVIDQAEVPVVVGDDESTLHERIKVVERQMLVRVVADLVSAAERTSPGTPS